MESGTRELIVRGTAAAKVGDVDEARFYLEWALRRGDADQAQEIEIYLWLSELYEDEARRRECLEMILAADPYHPQARRKLAVLDGRLDPDEIVDPDQLDRPTETRRSVCPQCGGPLFFAPDGQRQTCERCGWRTGETAAEEAAQDPGDLLAQGIAAARAKQRQDARRRLQAVTTHADATPAQQIQAWLWLSGVHETPEQRRACLEAVLRLDPQHAVARKGLARLGAEEAAPDAETSPETAPPATALKARRMVCPQCGGNLRSDGGRVRCAYCGYQSTLLEAMKRGVVRDATVDEQDFAITLATGAGHTRPQGMRALACETCRAEFVLGPGVLSLTCPYCGSSYVAKTGDERSLIAPEGVVPFAVDRDAAGRAFRAWLDEHKLPRDVESGGVFGLYLPVWTFDVGGILRWRRQVSRRDWMEMDEPGIKISLGQGMRLEVDSTPAEDVETGELPIDFDDLLVAASHTLPKDLMSILQDYDLSGVVPYRPSYLADQPAEIYDVPVSDASLVAREQALRASQRRLAAKLSLFGRNLQLDSSRMMIYAYKLILLPLWVTRYRMEDVYYRGVINGQTGTVHGQTPPGGLRKFFKGLLG
jgi:uncharacterized Zn finger protein (UPF0148 family)